MSKENGVQILSATFLDIISSYLKNLFSSSSHSTLDMDHVLSYVRTRVTREMNDSIPTSFSSEEVRQALKDMHPAKAPGPDGLPALFY